MQGAPARAASAGTSAGAAEWMALHGVGGAVERATAAVLAARPVCPLSGLADALCGDAPAGPHADFIEPAEVYLSRHAVSHRVAAALAELTARRPESPLRALADGLRRRRHFGGLGRSQGRAADGSQPCSSDPGGPCSACPSASSGGPRLIGQCHVWLTCLNHMIDQQVSTPIVSAKGFKVGHLSVDIVPLDANGKEGPWDDCEEQDPFVEDPEELLGRSNCFIVRIRSGRFDESRWPRCRCRYRVSEHSDWPDWFSSEEVPVAADGTFNVGCDHTHCILWDRDLLRIFERTPAVFQVLGPAETGGEAAGPS
eukprot:TRINITY_DN24899_c0_g1_i2.p1 TRINITY_DN24899_c0_g1~~TRINITY_DN24899_c0_g1_i2.p1  ORF type:complete len:348 (+),score=53.77 TRINITY_DN24899_c0_g1_i2:110-1045(+)